MKLFFSFWLKAMPFTIGMALSLIALCFLVKFYDYGLFFEEQEIWLFLVFFLVGFPTLTYGLNKLSSDSEQHSSAGNKQSHEGVRNTK